MNIQVPADIRLSPASAIARFLLNLRCRIKDGAKRPANISTVTRQVAPDLPRNLSGVSILEAANCLCNQFCNRNMPYTRFELTSPVGRLLRKLPERAQDENARFSRNGKNVTAERAFGFDA